MYGLVVVDELYLAFMGCLAAINFAALLACLRSGRRRMPLEANILQGGCGRCSLKVIRYILPFFIL
jgi:hypothetical protein